MGGCSLFVPQVRGSSTCSVCRKGINSHSRESVFYIPAETIYGTLPGTGSVRGPQMRDSACVVPTTNSAFSSYRREGSAGEGTSSSTSSSTMSTTPSTGNTSNNNLQAPAQGEYKYSPGVLLRPRPIRPASHSPALSRADSIYSHLPQEDNNEPLIYKKIRGKEKLKERSSSMGEINAYVNSSPKPPSPTLKELPRANNFKQLLTRFQSADRSGDHRVARRQTFDGHRDGVSSPQRASSASTRENSIRDRNYNALQSQQSYHAYPACSYREPSPLSHTGSTPPVPEREFPKPPPLTITIPTPKTRRAMPSRWIKETDIDDPATLPISPTCALTPDHTPPNETPPSSPRSLVREPSQDAVRLRTPQRMFHRLEHDSDSRRSTPSGICERRSSVGSRRGDRSIPLSPLRSDESRSSVCHIPVRVESSHSGLSTPDQKAKQLEMQYQQMTMSHVNALSVVCDRLLEYLRSREDPLPREAMENIEFRQLMFRSTQPTLIKGTSLFYDAILPRNEQPDYEVTVMIAPSSQYAPLLRRGAECGRLSIPPLIELEDHHGDVVDFLKRGGHAPSSRNVRVVILPRLHLCSFHSLAAHKLHQTMSAEDHERHVTFVAMQLLSALKALQSDQVEFLSYNFKEFLIGYRHTSFQDVLTKIKEYPSLIFLPETVGVDQSSECDAVGLCRYALRALCTLMHHKMDGKAPIIPNRTRFSRALLACGRELEADRSSSLTRAKNILEVAFWAEGQAFDTEHQAKMWLDMQRAECLNDTLQRILNEELDCGEGVSARLHVDFLLSISPRSLHLCHVTLQNTHF